MAGTTPLYALPYPTGTDRVMDGDNAMEALARAVENMRRLLGYGMATANQGGISGETDLTGLSVTVTIPAGRILRIAAHVWVLSTVANDVGRVTLRDGVTSIALGTLPNLPVSASVGPTSDPATLLVNPTAGVHTYKATLTRMTGTGTLTSQASAGTPAWLSVEDMGAA